MEIIDFKNAFPKLAHRLGPQNTALLATLMREREVPAETTLIEDRAPADSVYLVIEGEFRVEVPRTDGAIEVDRIGRGKWIGETPLFSNDHLSTSRIVATSPSRVLEMQHAQFWSARTDNPDLASVLTREFVDHMSERVRTADELISHCLQKAASAQASPPSQA